MIAEVGKKIFRKLLVDAADFRHTVLLAGTGRSGTTWLEEAINYRNDFRIMFEPFHSKKTGILANWNYRQYLRSDENRQEFIEPLSRIVGGKVRHEWIDQFNRRLFYRKRLIKDIRAQLLLKCIHVRFPQIPLILMLRHPCAVAASKLKLGWETHLEDFLVQSDLISDFLAPFKSAMQAASDPFDRHIFMWCVENYVPLRQFRQGGILVVFYEALCQNPEQEIKRVFAHIGAEVDPEVLKTLARPSALSRKESAVVSGADLVSSWRKDISTSQIDRAAEICGLFGLNALYDESDLPRLNGQAALDLDLK